MPKINFTYASLPMIARGYANCIVTFRGLSGSKEEWQDIDGSDFTADAFTMLADDCAKFLAAAEALHPDGKAGIGNVICHLELGWRFFTTRQGVGYGYESLVPGDFGRRLNVLAESFPKIDVAVINGKIGLLG